MGLTKGKTFEPERDIPDLTGKVIFVTGGNTGLGEEAILQLAKHNPSRIYMGARTASKAEAAINGIKSAVPNTPVIHIPLDLTSFESIRAAADAFEKAETRLDILLNNAGIMAGPLSFTKEGYESQFGTNHMGHFLLTKSLLPVLLKTAEQPGADVRIVNVSSVAHTGAQKGVTLDQQKLAKEWTWRRYCESKLANILFTKELARRYPSITSVVVHPGVIFSNLWTPGLAENVFMKMGSKLLQNFIGVSVSEGAKNQLWAATAPIGKESVENGKYYVPVGSEENGSKQARDEKRAAELWVWSEEEVEKHPR